MAGSGNGTGGSGGGSGAGAGGGLGGQPDVGTFEGFTGVLHRIGLNRDGPCVLDTAGLLSCENTFARPPSVALATFGLSSDIQGDSGCGLDANGLAHCWGSGIEGPTPAGPFSAIGVGDGNVCGVRPNGALTCWGDDDSLRAVPAGQFVDVSVTDGRACAVAAAGHLECWGTRDSTQGGRVDGTFQQVVVSSGARCTLDTAGAVDCLPTLEGAALAGPFEEISAGTNHVCGLRADGSVACRGAESIGRVEPPPGTWSDVVSSSGSACVRAEDGQSTCWGDRYGDGGSVLACEQSETRLDGTLDGTAVSFQRNASKQATFDDLPGFRWTYRTSPGTGVEPGFLVLEGTEEHSNTPWRSLANGQSVMVDYALLHTGASETDAGTFYCSGGGSTATFNIDELTLALENVHALGRCPGTPVEGELTVCYGCASALLGSVEGTAVALSGDQGSNIGAQAGISAIHYEDGTLSVVMKTEGGTIAWGVVAMPFNGPHAGAVYCAGSGSSWMVVDESTQSILVNLSKLSTCPTETTTDSLAGCVR